MSRTQVIIVNSPQGLVVANKQQRITVSRGSVITVQQGSASSLSSPFTCSEDVTAYQVLAAFGASVRPATVTDLTHAANVVGLALTDCLAGDEVEVVTSGRVTFSGWNWNDTLPVFLGLTPGEIVQDDPEAVEGAAFTIRLGVVRNPTTIDLNILQSVLY